MSPVTERCQLQYLLAIMIYVVIISVGIWDIYVAASGNPEDTVTLIVRQWSSEFPVLPLMTGLVIGHLFWSTCPPGWGPKKVDKSDLRVQCQVKGG
jgi:hypothetical protein